jgi:HEAT repeat protein
MTRLLVIGAVVALCAGPAFAQKKKGKTDVAGKPAAEVFAALLPALGKGDAAVQTAWQDVCLQAGAPGREAQRAEVCELMTAQLGPHVPTSARVFLLKQLERIGREESVAVIAAVYTTGHMDAMVYAAALRALAANPSPKATLALTIFLEAESGKSRIAVLNALGYRADPAAVPDLTKELAGDDEAAGAAARALGRIPTADAVTALTKARSSAKGATRRAISDALLAQGDRLLRAEKTDTAAAIFKELENATEPKPVRLAALRGSILAAGDAGGERVAAVLAGDDPAATAVAVAQIEGLSAAALKPLAAKLDALPVPARVSVLTALAARGDRSQSPVALAAAKSGEPAVQQAGVQALGRLGDSTSVDFLLDLVGAGTAPLAGLAADSLARLAADGVNEKLIASLGTSPPAKAVTVIGVLERRKTATAVPALLAAAANTDAGVRAAALAGLRGLAGPADVPQLVTVFLSAKGKDRDAAGEAIVAACLQIPDPQKRAGPVLATLAGAAKGHTADLLPILGRLGGPDALEFTRDALGSNDMAIRSAGRTALLVWPDATVTEDLFELALGATDPTELRAAIRAVVRVNTTATDRSPDERRASLAALKRAMGLADRDEERQAILAGAGFVRDIGTLRFVVPYLDQPALAQAACKGVVELAHSKNLREPNKAEFDKPLDRVIAICKDKGLVERAKQYKEGR